MSPLSERSQRHDAVVTLWYVTTADPAGVLAARPKADRGYGRKLLALMNPNWPITVIGQFPLNRSAPASAGEFYIGGYPRLAVVQTVVEDATRLSELPQRLVRAIPAADVYVFAANRDCGLGGFAHWHGHTLKRSFVARRDRVYEDLGMPEGFELPFWAGERGEALGGISLPFEPVDMLDDAQQAWLGFVTSPQGPTVDVVGYAIDGRPEPKAAQDPYAEDPGAALSAAATKLQLADQQAMYDDYTAAEDPAAAAFSPAAVLAAGATRMARVTGSALRGAGIKLAGAAFSLKERIRTVDQHGPTLPKLNRGSGAEAAGAAATDGDAVGAAEPDPRTLETDPGAADTTASDGEKS